MAAAEIVAQIAASNAKGAANKAHELETLDAAAAVQQRFWQRKRQQGGPGSTVMMQAQRFLLQGRVLRASTQRAVPTRAKGYFEDGHEKMKDSWPYGTI